MPKSDRDIERQQSNWNTGPMSAEPTLPVSQPMSAERFLRDWYESMKAADPHHFAAWEDYENADPFPVEHGEYTFELFCSSPMAVHALKSWTERDRELQQAREELDHFRTVTDYARSESGSGPGDLQGYIEQLWANRGDAAIQLSEAREEIARLKFDLRRAKKLVHPVPEKPKS